MSDILDGMRSYPLFTYPQVSESRAAIFFIPPPPLQLGLMVLVPATLNEKNKYNLKTTLTKFVSVVFSCVCFLKRWRGKKCLRPPSDPGVLLLPFIFRPDKEHYMNMHFPLFLLTTLSVVYWLPTGNVRIQICTHLSLLFRCYWWDPRTVSYFLQYIYDLVCHSKKIHVTL